MHLMPLEYKYLGCYLALAISIAAFINTTLFRFSSNHSRYFLKHFTDHLEKDEIILVKPRVMPISLYSVIGILLTLYYIEDGHYSTYDIINFLPLFFILVSCYLLIQSFTRYVITNKRVYLYNCVFRRGQYLTLSKLQTARCVFVDNILGIGPIATIYGFLLAHYTPRIFTLVEFTGAGGSIAIKGCTNGNELYEKTKGLIQWETCVCNPNDPYWDPGF